MAVGLPGIAEYMSRKRIVVVGGGGGNYITLTGLKHLDCDVTAVVAMTDSGGSSGRLRDELNQLPHGDIRRCLVALAPDDSSTSILVRLFDYRFNGGGGLSGHSFGNLLLSALTEVTGNTATAISEAGAMLGIKGKVLPVTLTKTTLVAHLKDGSEIREEANIDQRGAVDGAEPTQPIDYVYLDPPAYAYRPAVDALESADAIVLGPGDIYTSILPNLLVKDIAEAIRSSNALKICVSNLMTKPGESDSFKASDFARLSREYLGTSDKLDYLIVNNSPFPERLLSRYYSYGQAPVETDKEACLVEAKEIIELPLLSSGVYIRHDPIPLARTIMDIVEGRVPTGQAGNA